LGYAEFCGGAREAALSRHNQKGKNVVDVFTRHRIGPQKGNVLSLTVEHHFLFVQPMSANDHEYVVSLA
jgi:hypothetical protein